MDDKDPPMWVPTTREEPTEEDKEEAKKSSSFAAELKMMTGYLISKS